ncbi:MAG: hypothetical protein R2704_08415 [Microthrixaceae bacterium]
MTVLATLLLVAAAWAAAAPRRTWCPSPPWRWPPCPSWCGGPTSATWRW